MINVGELINDPDFAQPEPFIVTRNIGTYVDGRFVQNTTTIQMTGVIIPDTSRKTEQDAHGDQATGFIKLYTTEPLHETESDQAPESRKDRTADEVTWRRQKYRITTANDFLDFGYYYAEAVRKLGS